MGKASWKFAPGDEIVPGRFFLKVLGGGKQYEACLVWNEHLYATSVLKLLRPDRIGLEKARRTLRTEAQLLASTAHPLLVRGLAADYEAERPWLELEYIEGLTLSRLLHRDGPLLPEELLLLARQLASILHYLHGEQIVHLDVKPGNIIMHAAPRLIDMSLARKIERLAQIAGFVGSAQYAAPEQADPERYSQLGPAADVWGLGATLYRATTGRRPFDNHRELKHPQTKYAPAPLEAAIPRRLADIIISCLADDPTQRPNPAEIIELAGGKIALSV